MSLTYECQVFAWEFLHNLKTNDGSERIPEKIGCNSIAIPGQVGPGLHFQRASQI